MKILAIFFVILTFSLALLGQSNKPCSSNLLKAPVRGFTIGMKKAEISKIFENVLWESQSDGTEKAVLTIFKDKERFKGVQQLIFHTNKDSLFQIEITYDESVKVENIGTFADEIAKSWTISEKWKGQGFALTIECRERFLLLSLMPPAKKILSITNLITENEITNKLKAKKPVFKP